MHAQRPCRASLPYVPFRMCAISSAHLWQGCGGDVCTLSVQFAPACWLGPALHCMPTAVAQTIVLTFGRGSGECNVCTLVVQVAQACSLRPAPCALYDVCMGSAHLWQGLWWMIRILAQRPGRASLPSGACAALLEPGVCSWHHCCLSWQTAVTPPVQECPHPSPGQRCTALVLLGRKLPVPAASPQLLGQLHVSAVRLLGQHHYSAVELLLMLHVRADGQRRSEPPQQQQPGPVLHDLGSSAAVLAPALPAAQHCWVLSWQVSAAHWEHQGLHDLASCPAGLCSVFLLHVAELTAPSLRLLSWQLSAACGAQRSLALECQSPGARAGSAGSKGSLVLPTAVGAASSPAWECLSLHGPAYLLA